MKFYVSDITPDMVVDRIEVHAFEMNLYLVKLTVGEQCSMLYDKQGQIMKFAHTQAIRTLFATCRVQASVLIHDSPYDEMVGNPPKHQQPMVLPFAMRLPTQE